jgi:hypothetical protein
VRAVHEVQAKPHVSTAVVSTALATSAVIASAGNAREAR